ncbi:hypothetical protein EJ02DRAFT_447711 [Clathrospora elynae]|uniref:Uncharacterized protein n=1 Tax=Clathrospora elynae TaxID=706981 RepID=A0A6A5SER3_9PLEO|nr:hypothetical protein EJ02DRAFT_447711 [Clathrospora elynae]
MRFTLFTATIFSGCTLAACERAFRAEYTALYPFFQTQGTPAFLLPSLPPNFTYTEKFQPANISSPFSILSKSPKAAKSRVVMDPVLCTAFTEIIVTAQSHPYVVGVRIKREGTLVKKIETPVSDAGDWFQQSKYYRARGGKGAYTDAQMSCTKTCALGLPSTVKVVNRRYVVDIEMWVMDVYVGFPGMRYIHTIPTCGGHLGCGLNGNYVPVDRWANGTLLVASARHRGAKRAM